MKTKLLAVVLTGLLLAADEKADEKAKKGLDTLQGTWNAVSAEENGKALPKADAEGLQLVIKGEKYVLKLKGETLEEGTLKVDAGKSPKTIDIKILKGEDKGKEQLGLYELDKDKLKLCVGAPGKQRPKELGAKQGSEASVYVFQRPKDVG